MFVPKASRRFLKSLTAKQVGDPLGMATDADIRLGAVCDHGEDLRPPRYALSDRVSGV